MTWNRRMLEMVETNGTQAIEMDAVLASEEHLAPSSGFLAGVMERVREEAAAPEPIPFPWKIAIPGILLAVAVLGWGGFELVRAAATAMRGMSLSLPHEPMRLAGPAQTIGWIALALAISLASIWFSRRLAGSPRLL